MNELQVIEQNQAIPAKLDVAKRALVEATEDWQRIDIRDYAKAVAAATAILNRKDIQVQAANLMQDAERAIAKANPAPTVQETIKEANRIRLERKSVGEVSNPSENKTSQSTSTPITRNLIKDARKAHNHLSDEEFEAIKEKAVETGTPLTRSALIEEGRRKRTERQHGKFDKERNAKLGHEGNDSTPTSHKIYLSDNLSILSEIPDGSINLAYTDPPFNTGKPQTDRGISYSDNFGDTEAYIEFLRPRFEEVHRVLHPTGSLFFHSDRRESHYCKMMLDEIFGSRECFINEIVWVYDFGGRSNKRWAAKHDTIFWYAKDPNSYTFNADERDRIDYMAPGLVSKEKAAKGKFPTDVWWNTIVHTTSAERTGYPTQKPLRIAERIVKVHSKVGDTVLDLFAGSGTLGEAAAQLDRNSILIDNNPDAIRIMLQRLEGFGAIHVNAKTENEHFEEEKDG